jgi:hypothetical protein
MTGVEMIAAERKRHVEEHGWTPEHDDEHDSGELTAAAFWRRRGRTQNGWIGSTLCRSP